MSELAVDGLVFAGGLAALTLGADWVVRGGARIAERMGLPQLVIGLTVVAFGTSAPELVVSGGAAIRNEPGMAVGNVMGSTVANVGLIVGLGALLRPVDVHRRVIVRESPLLLVVLAVVVVLSLNEALGRLDGLGLLTGFALYLYFLFRWSAEEGRLPRVSAEVEGVDPGRASLLLDWVRTLAGLVALVVGGHFVLESARDIAIVFGVPDAVIGATMVAVGTSLPELASTTAAALRGYGDMAVGNVIGSNVFNLGLVLGSAALLRPLHLPPRTVVAQVLPAFFFCVLLIPLGYKGHVTRLEGLLLLILFGGFVYWVFL